MRLLIQILGGASAGLLSHWLWFVHGEHDRLAGRYVRGYPILGLLLILICNRILEIPLLFSIVAAFNITASYFVALFSSIVCYRLLLAPTRHIPGPYRLKISKLCHFWKNLNLDNFNYLDALHRQYGDIVRTGPNEVTCFTTEAFEKIYGPNSQCRRSVYYEALPSLVSMVHTKDLNIHGTWRKVWDQAFGQKALEGYEPIVYFYAQRLIKWLDAAEDKPIEISSCFQRYAFDVIGRIGLDVDFNLLEGRPSRVYAMYEAGAKILGWITPIPWLASATSWIPGLLKNQLAKEHWALSELEQKRTAMPRGNSVMDHLINEAEARGGIDANKSHLLGEWLVVMAAGIDPMVKCLTDMMWYLAQDKKHVEKIRSELATISSLKEDRQLMQSAHLQAVIYETFRLNPAIPSGGTREAPAEGLEIGGVVIPGNTIVLVPQHTLFRRPDCFVKPDEFIPERWTSKPELVLHKAAFQPWSSGRYQCVGKNLGLMEIRMAAALLIETFDVSFAKGYDKMEVFDKMMDHFVSMPGPLHVVLSRRSYA